MDEGGKRPGGLTALAVINFVFGGFDFLGVLGALFAVFVLSQEPAPQPPPEETESRATAEDGAGNEETRAEGERDDPFGQVRENMARSGKTASNQLVLAALLAPLATLLILSGIGYLRQKRVMGRYLGSCYALLSVPATLYEFSYATYPAVEGVEPGLMRTVHLLVVAVAMVYPLVTLFLVNVVFKEDLAQ